MQIIRKDADFLYWPDGRRLNRPLLLHIQHTKALTQQQLMLANELEKLAQPMTEEGEGRKAQIMRQIAELEMKKHPAHRVQNAGIFPDEYAKVD